LWLPPGVGVTGKGNWQDGDIVEALPTHKPLGYRLTTSLENKHG